MGKKSQHKRLFNSKKTQDSRAKRKQRRKDHRKLMKEAGLL